MIWTQRVLATIFLCALALFLSISLPLTLGWVVLGTAMTSVVLHDRPRWIVTALLCAVFIADLATAFTGVGVVLIALNISWVFLLRYFLTRQTRLTALAAYVGTTLLASIGGGLIVQLFTFFLYNPSNGLRWPVALPSIMLHAGFCIGTVLLLSTSKRVPALKQLYS